MRVKLVVVLILLVLSTTISTANPGGKGDDVRSRDCAGSCHASSSSNGVSTAILDIGFPDEVYAGLLIEVQTSVSEVEVSSTDMVGLTLLINSDGAKDLPANDGWEIITDPNGGTNNYVEVSDSFSAQNTVNRSWTLRAPSNPGTYELYLAVQHGTPEGGVAMSGISEINTVLVEEVPENLPRLADDWKPTNVRGIGEETTITIETINAESITVELMNGAEIITIPVVDNKFTIPASVNPGIVQWRVILEGEGPTQTSPWFRLTAQEPGWEIDETALYLQSIAMFLLFAGLVLIRRPVGEDIVKNYDNTDQIVSEAYSHPSTDVASDTTSQPTEIQDTASTPPLPAEGLPAGWTMEQWEYYGQEHLDKLSRGEI